MAMSFPESWLGWYPCLESGNRKRLLALETCVCVSAVMPWRIRVEFTESANMGHASSKFGPNLPKIGLRPTSFGPTPAKVGQTWTNHVWYLTERPVQILAEILRVSTTVLKCSELGGDFQM